MRLLSRSKNVEIVSKGSAEATRKPKKLKRQMFILAICETANWKYDKKGLRITLNAVSANMKSFPCHHVLDMNSVSAILGFTCETTHITVFTLFSAYIQIQCPSIPQYRQEGLFGVAFQESTSRAVLLPHGAPVQTKL